MSPDRLTFHDETCCRCGTPDDLIRISEFGKALCPDCYPEFVRSRIERTVRRFRMIPKGRHVAVAVSGGSDSAMLLHALARTRSRLSFRMTAIHIDMGLGDYSNACIDIVRRQCAAARVSLEIDFVRNYDITIEAISTWPVCAVCGGVRRALMPRLARRVGADVFATGHTLDDQLQFMLKNILSGRAVSPPPVLPATSFGPAKAKPLIQIPDAAGETYARIVDLPIIGEECPHFLPDTHRFKDIFDLLEKQAPMGKGQFWQAATRTARSACAPCAARRQQCASAPSAVFARLSRAKRRRSSSRQSPGRPRHLASLRRGVNP